MGLVRQALVAICLLLVAFFPVPSATASWAEPAYDAEVPVIMRQSVAKAIDTTADLKSYIQAVMLYDSQPRAKAEEIFSFFLF